MLKLCVTVCKNNVPHGSRYQKPSLLARLGRSVEMLRMINLSVIFGGGVGVLVVLLRFVRPVVLEQ